mgnify:CR=1 FL=1
MMKRTLLPLCLVSAAAAFSVFTPLCAVDFETITNKADQLSTVQERLDYLLKAAEENKDPKLLLQIAERGFDLSKKLKMGTYLSKFAEMITNSTVVSPERKANAYYEYLMAQPRPSWNNPGISYKEWEKFLEMPGKDPKEEKEAMLRLADVYHAQNLWYKEIAMLRKALEHPKVDNYQKQDILINLSGVYLAMHDMDKSLDALREMLKLSPTPQRQAKTYLLMGDTMLTGYGWYYVPNEKQYEELCGYYLKVMNNPKLAKTHYNEALTKLVHAAYERQKWKEVISLSNKYLTNNKKVNSATWMQIKDWEGNSHLRLEQYEEAVKIYEDLYKFKYNLADTCMSLGQSYYGNNNYTMALAMYDEAIVELGQADDARPAICKGWVNRLKWFNQGEKILADLYLKRAQRLNAEARAKGLPPVMEEKKADSLRPFENKEKKKKKPETLEDLNKAEEEDILDGGLDLD